MNTVLEPIRHGLLLAVTAMICGALWAAYLATQHEPLHSGFEQQELVRQATPMNAPGLMQEHEHPPGTSEHTDTHANPPMAMHSHSGSLAKDAMQRLLRGHIHWMGLGILSAAMLLIVAFTSLKPGWKKALGWTFGIGALAYPPAWILMGFRTVSMGPEAAEASVMWLFGPAVGLLLASMVAVLGVLLIETLGWRQKGIFARFFEVE